MSEIIEKKQIEFMVNELVQSVSRSEDITLAESMTLIAETLGIRPPTIMVVEQSYYGNPLYRPICKKSQSFCRIAKTKNLTQEMLREIKSMGYRVITPEKEL